MTPHELTKSILQKAFRGELNTNKPEETSNSVYEDIKKHGFSSSKYAKFSKDLVDYDVPSNWSWCMFYNVVSLENGESSSGQKLPYLEAKYLRGKNEAKILSEGEFVKEGTRVILVDGENSGEVFEIKEKGYMGSTFKVLNINKFVDEQFVLYFMKYHQDDYRNNKKGAAIPHLSKDVFFEMPFPLPPMDEQKRIVLKIKEIMSLIPYYEESWSKLEVLNEMFPKELEKSLLDYAFKGKLSSHLNSDTPVENTISDLKKAKKQLLEAKLIYSKAPTSPFYDSNDYPFEIPDNWAWVQLSDISLIQEGAGIRKFQYRDNGIQLLCVTNILEGEVDLSKKQLFVSKEEYNEKYTHLTLNVGDIVTSCSGGSWGKVAIFKGKETIMLNTSTLRLRFFNDLADNEFLYFLAKSPMFKKQLLMQLSGMQPNFGYAHYSRIMIPFPPLEEQRRICVALKELLPICNKLVK